MEFTLATVGTALALGALKSVGSEVMGQWMEDQGIAERTTTIINNRIEEAVKQLARYLHVALNQQYLEETLDKLRALGDQLESFHISPEARVNSLHEMGDLASKIVQALSSPSMGLLGYSSYPMAVGLWLAVLQERQRYSEPGIPPDNPRVLPAKCKAAFEQMTKWNTEDWVTWHESRFWGVFRSRILRKPYVYSFLSNQYRFPSAEERDDALEKAKKDELNKLVTERMLPHFDTLRTWTEIFAGKEEALAQRSIDLAPVSVEAYDQKREEEQRAYYEGFENRNTVGEAELAASERQRRTALLISALYQITSG